MSKERPIIFECDICGHNFGQNEIEEFWSDMLWACHNCLEEIPLEIGQEITEMLDDRECGKEESIAEERIEEWIEDKALVALTIAHGADLVMHRTQIKEFKDFICLLVEEIWRSK